MFPVKLHYILSQRNNAISWTADGTSVRILDKELLVKDYLPIYFNQKSFASFRHQLNAYGFVKVSKGENVNCYFHPFFNRNDPSLLFRLFRLAPRAKRVRKDGKLVLVPLETASFNDGSTVESTDSDPPSSLEISEPEIYGNLLNTTSSSHNTTTATETRSFNDRIEEI